MTRTGSIAGDQGDPQGFPALIRAYLDALAVKGYSPQTLEQRHTCLKSLAVWLAERGVTQPGEVTRPVLEAYQRHLFQHRKRDGAPLAASTQRLRLTAVRAFFGWLTKRRLILYNPASELELPRAEQRLPRAVLTPDEAEQILAQPGPDTTQGLRDRALLELLYATGIRRTELARLGVFDLDPARRMLTVRQGKGRRDRIVPTGDRAAAWTQRYLHHARPQLATEPDPGWLFLTADGRPFTPKALTRLVCGYVSASGVGKPGACHLFRHTLATLMLDGGADIRHVQQMLGHASIATTQIYTHVSLTQLAAVHAATHPAAGGPGRGGAIERPAAAFDADALTLALHADTHDELSDLTDDDLD